ncbi:MAG TPA: hypothetical protein VKU82_02425 [Planctomycetaceae bacterium]|nr:hypothetical protein [Planctomycetaceae bacterium]
MKRFLSAMTGLALAASASGCCCDWCNWGCNPCAPCGPRGCAPTYYGAPPAATFLTPATAPAIGLAPTTTSAMPVTYYGAPVATAALVPVESLPTY